MSLRTTAAVCSIDLPGLTCEVHMHIHTSPPMDTNYSSNPVVVRVYRNIPLMKRSVILDVYLEVIGPDFEHYY